MSSDVKPSVARQATCSWHSRNKKSPAIWLSHPWIVPLATRPLKIAPRAGSASEGSTLLSHGTTCERNV